MISALALRTEALLRLLFSTQSFVRTLGDLGLIDLLLGANPFGLGLWLLGKQTFRFVWDG